MLLVYLQQENVKKPKNSWINIDEENLHIFFINLKNFNVIFRKNVSYNHEKTGLYPLAREFSFGKTKTNFNSINEIMKMKIKNG